ncbi:MAG: hypothetical protein JXQ71_11400 [Verrucomicrobia bacterium]|nr:hypothetical protein [Verrucomicrobiota bacterium]
MTKAGKRPRKTHADLEREAREICPKPRPQNVVEDMIALAGSGSAVAGARVDFNPVTAVPSEYIDTDVAAGRTYYYVVTAENSAGQESACSAETSATLLAGPTALVALTLTVPTGTVSGGIDATRTADGQSQSIAESSTGSKGRSGLVAEYTLGSVADPASVTGLILQFEGRWTSFEEVDPLMVCLWNQAAGTWDFTDWIVGPVPALFEVNCATTPLDYIDSNGQLRVLFMDSAALDKERKDALDVDLLVGWATSGPNVPPQPSANLQAVPGDTLVHLTWDLARLIGRGPATWKAAWSITKSTAVPCPRC